MVILYKLTSRSRPAKMYKAYKSVADNAVLNLVMILSIDSDDSVTLNSEELKQMAWDKRVSIHTGTSKNKIDAINRDVPKQGWDILVNLSDDQIFTVKGFDKVISEHCTNSTFLHLPDGYVNERLATMSIMSKAYYDMFGYIYHPDYASLWCDNEAMEVAQALGCYKYVNEHIFTHEHPAWTGEKPDEQLEHTQKFYRQDNRTYIKRKALGFPINSVYS
jgi:hypothetical protein